MAYQAVRATIEATPGTFQAAADPEEITLIPLDRDNAFPGRPTPIFWGPIRAAHSSNRPIQDGSAQIATKGSLSMFLRPSQGIILLPWACSISGTPLDLGSITLDHITRLAPPTNTLIYQRHLGCKCNKFTLSANNNGQGVLVQTMYDYDFLNTATITSSDFAVPALDDYVDDLPMTFPMLAGNVTIGSSRTNFSSLSLTVENLIDPLYDEGTKPNHLYWGGRNVSLTVRIRHKTAADRTAFNAVTHQAVSFALNDGTNTFTFSLHGDCIIRDVKDDLPLRGVGSQDITVSALVDTSAGSDFDLTIAP